MIYLQTSWLSTVKIWRNRIWSLYLKKKQNKTKQKQTKKSGDGVLKINVHNTTYRNVVFMLKHTNNVVSVEKQKKNNQNKKELPTCL